MLRAKRIYKMYKIDRKEKQRRSVALENLTNPKLLDKMYSDLPMIEHSAAWWADRVLRIFHIDRSSS